MDLSNTQKRALLALERKAHSWAEDYCNGTVSEKTTDSRALLINDEVRDIIGEVPKGFFWNLDARGYALKIDNDKATIPQGMATDWGGFGILAHKETKIVTL